MEHAGGQRRIDARRLEHLGEMFRCAGAAGGDQRHAAHRAHGAQLRDVVARRTPSLAMQLSTISPAPRRCTSRTQSSGAARGIARAGRIAGELLHAIALRRRSGCRCRRRRTGRRSARLSSSISSGSLQRRRIDGDLLGAAGQHLLGLARPSGCRRRRRTECRDRAPRARPSCGPPSGPRGSRRCRRTRVRRRPRRDSAPPVPECRRRRDDRESARP